MHFYVNLYLFKKEKQRLYMYNNILDLDARKKATLFILD